MISHIILWKTSFYRHATLLVSPDDLNSPQNQIKIFQLFVKKNGEKENIHKTTPRVVFGSIHTEENYSPGSYYI